MLRTVQFSNRTEPGVSNTEPRKIKLLQNLSKNNKIENQKCLNKIQFGLFSGWIIFLAIRSNQNINEVFSVVLFYNNNNNVI